MTKGKVHVSHTNKTIIILDIVATNLMFNTHCFLYSPCMYAAATILTNEAFNQRPVTIR